MLVALIVTISVVNALQFGVHVPLNVDANTDTNTTHYHSYDTLTATLIWNNTYLLQCLIFPSNFYGDVWSYCQDPLIIDIHKHKQNCTLNDSTITPLLSQSSNNVSNIIQLDISNNDGVWIDAIKIIDNQTEYTFTTFCTELSFLTKGGWDWQSKPPNGHNLTSNCTHFNNLKQWSFFCMDTDFGCNEYKSLQIILPSNLSMNEALIYQVPNETNIISCNSTETTTSLATNITQS